MKRKLSPQLLYYYNNHARLNAKRRKIYSEKIKRKTAVEHKAKTSSETVPQLVCLKCGAVFTSPPDARGQYDMFHATRAWEGRRRASIADQVERGIISADESKRLLAGLKADLHVVADWAGR